MTTSRKGDLLLPSGGYRRLKTFQLARLIYDITVRFTALYIPANSRTTDQMVQAARSGVQNIAEGSVVAATSAKLELNLYNVARASLEELRLDYQDFLRQHSENEWQKDSPLYKEFVTRHIARGADFKKFIDWSENAFSPSVQIRTNPYKSVYKKRTPPSLRSLATTRGSIAEIVRIFARNALREWTKGP